ncbi:MAG: M48 family metalloprotease [Desulfovibrionaceae bacterium]|nr:M48 family metalloprotease [Desulfovibrionaceae bacterium]
MMTYLVFFISLLFSFPLYAGFGNFSLADEEKLGKQFSVFVKSSLPIIYEPEIQEYMDKIVQRLTKDLPSNPYTFKIYMISDPAINAFATPGGYIFVHTGLFLAMENESQLAGVIAHEIAHITNRHIAKRIERTQKITLTSLLTGLAGLALGPAGIGVLLGSLGVGQNSMLYFSRIDEGEADKAGMQYLVQAGYNPFGLSQSFDIIKKNMTHKGIGNAPIYLSTHPDVSERVQSTYTQATTFSTAIQERVIDNSEFTKLKLLIRARYDLPERAHALLNNDTSCNALLGKGIVYKRNKQYAKSNELFTQALTCDPTNQITYREGGIMAFESNDFDTAKNLLIQAILIDRNDYFSLFYLARLYSETKEHEQSIQLFKQVSEQLPEDIEVHYYYGRELGFAGKVGLGNIHLAYSAIYANRLRRAKHFIEQAKVHIQPEEDIELNKVESLYNERESFFKENGIPIEY